MTSLGALSGALFRPGLPPGLYEARAEPVRSRTVRLDTAGFIGLARRGPLNTPVPVASAAEFAATFGAPLPGQLLGPSIDLFFANGGRRAVVVRAMDYLNARTARAHLPGVIARLPGGAGRARIAARSPGAWANGMLLRMEAPRQPAPLGIVLAAGDPIGPVGTLVAPAGRLVPGATLRLYGTPTAPGRPPRTRLAVVRALARNGAREAVTLDAALPAAFRAAELLATAEEVRLRLTVALDGAVVETWDDAACDPAHPRFLPRLLGRRASAEALSAFGAAWGAGDAGSAWLRPSLTLLDTRLVPTAELLEGRATLLAIADLPARRQGRDAQETTRREDFLLPPRMTAAQAATDAPHGFLPFPARPGALDALDGWDAANETTPVALLALPDLWHPPPPEPEAAPAPEPQATCFGDCVRAALVRADPALPWPLLGADQAGLERMQGEIAAHAAARRRIALFDLPPGLAAAGIAAWRRNLASDRAALYAPWLRTGAGIVPAAGAAAGIIARREREAGVWAAPANAPVLNALRSGDAALPDPGFLHEERVNEIRDTGLGPLLMGGRTTSADPEWTHLSVRRLMDWLAIQIGLDLAFAPFEPNAPPLWEAMARTAERRLVALLDAGALAGARAADSYFVHCDRSTMSEGDLDNGRAVMLVGVAPAVPAEFIVFRLLRHGADDPRVEVLA